MQPYVTQDRPFWELWAGPGWSEGANLGEPLGSHRVHRELGCSLAAPVWPACLGHWLQEAWHPIWTPLILVIQAIFVQGWSELQLVFK